MVWLFLLAIGAHAAQRWGKQCGDCSWEVTDDFILQRVPGSAATCECNSIDFKNKYANASPGLIYSSVAEGFLDGVTVKWGIYIDCGDDSRDNGKKPFKNILENHFKGAICDDEDECSLDIRSCGTETIHPEAFNFDQNFAIDLSGTPIDNCDFKIGGMTELMIKRSNILTPCSLPLFQGTGLSLKKLVLAQGYDDPKDKASWGDLPVNYFQQFTELDQINFEKLGITSVPAGIFDNLPHLDDVRFSKNYITSLDVDLFKYNDMLTIVYFDENELTEIPAGIFSGKALDELLLNDNKLKSVDGLMDGVTTVYMDYLYLGNNMIEKVPADLISGLEGLTYLYEFHLNNNQLRHLPKNFVPGGMYTEYFYLNDNFFTGKTLTEAWAEASSSTIYFFLTNNLFTCRPTVEGDLDLYDYDDGFFDLPVCEAADACDTACYGRFRRKADADPASCGGGACPENGSECCEPLPKCECKDEWEQDSVSYEGCFANEGDDAGPWCPAKSYPCGDDAGDPEKNAWPYEGQAEFTCVPSLCKTDGTEWEFNGECCAADHSKWDAEYNNVVECCEHGVVSMGNECPLPDPCKDEMDWEYLPHEECTKYRKCMGGKSEIGECTDGMGWDTMFRQCSKDAACLPEPETMTCDMMGRKPCIKTEHCQWGGRNKGCKPIGKALTEDQYCESFDRKGTCPKSRCKWMTKRGGGCKAKPAE